MRSLAARALAAGLLAPAGLGLGACTRGVDDDHQAQARSAAEVFLKLCAGERGRDVANVVNGPALDAMMRAGAVRRGCAVILQQPGTPSAASFAAARVTRVETVGPLAHVTVVLGRQGLAPPRRAGLEAEREGDRWLVTSERLGA